MKKIFTFTLFLIGIVLLTSCSTPTDTAYTQITGIYGTDNISHAINISSDGQFVVNTETVFQEIAMHGELETKPARAFHVMGRRAGFASTTALNDIKEFGASTNDTFPILTGIEALQVVSSSPSDNATGIGARTVEVMYIDNSNNLITSSQISLNGTSAVPAGFTAKFIISMEVTSLGSSEVAIGNIVLQTVAGTVIQEQITSGGNRSLSSHFMIPSNYTGYLTSWEGASIVTSGVAQQQDMRIRATVDDEGNLSTVYHFLDTMFLASGTTSSQVDLPYIKLPQLTKIKVSTISSATATTTRADTSYCLFIVHN